MVLYCRLSFDHHATSVTRACNFRAQAIQHISHLLMNELALTLACSVILSRLDYCNAVLYKAPSTSIQNPLHVQKTAARIVLQAPRGSPAQPLLEQLHWLPVCQRINYKLAVMTYKIHNACTPPYPSQYITLWESTRQLCSFTVPLLHKLTRTHFANHAFPFSAHFVWNSLNTDTLYCSLLGTFKRHLKTFLFSQTFIVNCITRL